MCGTLLLHLLVLDRLLRGTEVTPQEFRLQPLLVEIPLQVQAPGFVEPLPVPAPPPLPPPTRDDPPARPAPVPRSASAPRPPPSAAASAADALPPPIPPAARAAIRLDQQRSAIAAEMARESAAQRRPFAGRSLDAMLPDADNGRLPGFRPRVGEDAVDYARKLAGILQRGLPQAAVDPDAPSDLLTEGWERAHHASDLAACERQYEELDREMRRQLCGEVRPPR